MKAAIPPFFWASATICNATVVLPEDSGPNISMILPLAVKYYCEGKIQIEGRKVIIKE
jgi:hypothetical protein